MPTSTYYYNERMGHTVEMGDGSLYYFELTSRVWGYNTPVWHMEYHMIRTEADVSSKMPYYAGRGSVS